MNNWKPIDRVREYGNQTKKVETSEFPNEPIKNFMNNYKEYRYVVVLSRNNIPLWCCQNYKDAEEKVKDENFWSFRKCHIVDLAYEQAERCCVRMKKRTRIKTGNHLKGKRLFTDFGGIGYYKVLKMYYWKEYSANAVTPSGSHWFGHSMAKIKTESGIIMKIPLIELGMRSTYADTGEMVLR